MGSLDDPGQFGGERRKLCATRLWLTTQGLDSCCCAQTPLLTTSFLPTLRINFPPNNFLLCSYDLSHFTSRPLWSHSRRWYFTFWYSKSSYFFNQLRLKISCVHESTPKLFSRAVWTPRQFSCSHSRLVIALSLALSISASATSIKFCITHDHSLWRAHERSSPLFLL